MTGETLGTRIRRARERRRLSQQELAAAVGASPRAVGDWENDRRKPRNRLGALEEVLGVRLDGEPQPEPAIPESLRQEIINTPGLTSDQRRAVIEAVERTLAKERGESAGGAWEPPAEPREPRRAASLSALPDSGRRLPFSGRQ